MDKKTITIVSLCVGFAALAYLAYNSITQLKNIEYDLFDIEEDIDFE